MAKINYIVFLIFTSYYVFGQQANFTKPQLNKSYNSLVKNLNLNDEQQIEAKVIFTIFDETRTEILNKVKEDLITKEKSKPLLKYNLYNRRENISTLFDEEQCKKMDLLDKRRLRKGTRNNKKRSMGGLKSMLQQKKPEL